MSEGLEVRENHKSPIQIPFCFVEYSRTPILEIFSQVLSFSQRARAQNATETVGPINFQRLETAHRESLSGLIYSGTPEPLASSTVIFILHYRCLEKPDLSPKRNESLWPEWKSYKDRPLIPI